MQRGEREKPADRRRTIRDKFKVGGHTMYLDLGLYPDGRLAEIFIDVAKAGSAFRAVMSAFAISISLGLQHGVPLEEYVEAYVDMDFQPNGMVRGVPEVTEASSALDLIFRRLAIQFLGRVDLERRAPPVPEKAAGPPVDSRGSGK